MWQPRSLVQVWAIWLVTGVVAFAVLFFVMDWPWQSDLVPVALSITWACAQTYGLRHGQLGSRSHDRADPRSSFAKPEGD
jgi:hypothetical protein